MMLEFTKEEQNKLGDKIKDIKEEFSKLLEKYNFEYDGHGLDLNNGYYDLFYYEKK